MKTRAEIIDDLIARAAAEDLGENGDITSRAVFDAKDSARACIRCKERGVVSGISLIAPILARYDSTLELDLIAEDGDSLEAGDVICYIQGAIIPLLSAERVILNFLQHLSGIATAARAMADAARAGGAQILDTRKTTPTLRLLEKEAVAHGGGVNHRFGLYDMVMIKDTHVKAAGGPDTAVLRARTWLREQGLERKTEVEVESFAHFKAVLETAPDRIMLDNMSCEEMQKAADMRSLVAPDIELEASGNVTLERVPEISRTGVDYISSGALTHSVQALDIHLLIL
ncbi:MAG: carboxylating nicotinate-nucleotide diphosphorylase [Fibrobacterota bacterium]